MRVTSLIENAKDNLRQYTKKRRKNLIEMEYE